jgi:CRP-like cAMP-binding protein
VRSRDPSIEREAWCATVQIKRESAATIGPGKPGPVKWMHGVTPQSRSLAENRLLASLPRSAQQRMLSNCDSVDLDVGQVLGTPGGRARYAYFPTHSYVSLVAPLDDHAGLEVSLVGNEGMIGTCMLLGVESAPLHAVVQGAGSAWRIDRTAFRQELEYSRVLRETLNRYVYVMIRQLAQTAACTRYHLLEPRLARWFLMTRDRANSNDFHATHAFLAVMLGVRRAGVTRAASSLQERRLIEYSRGSVSILDRRGLEAVACGCYAADKSSYAVVFV